MAFPRSCSCQGDCSICQAYAVGYLAETLLSKMLLETPVIIAALIPKAQDSSHCTWSQKFAIHVYEIQHGFHRHFECQRDVPGWWNPLAYASQLAKKYFTQSRSSQFNLGVISATEWFHSKLQTTGGKKDFLVPLFNQDRVFGFTRWSKLLLS